MRYDTPIYFVSKGESVRLPNGDWSDGEKTEVKAYAHVSDMSDETKLNVFGDVTTQGLKVILQGPRNVDFDYIRIDGRSWRVLRKRTLRRDISYEVGELKSV